MIKQILPVLSLCLLMCAAVPAARAQRLLEGWTPAATQGPAHATGVEARRLVAQAKSRGEVPGGAVDLMRLEALADGLDEARLARWLRDAGEDTDRTPLVRAVAWWLLRGRAQAMGSPRMVTEAVDALGLLRAFSVRAGSAPAPTEVLSPEGWRTYPAAMGAGVLWLDALLRPAESTRAVAVTRLVSAGGFAVLRLGYDDEVTVWLNGDEIYASSASHGLWLDQAAVPIWLRAGDNRLVVEVRQQHGAWRLMARITDAAGRPMLGITAHPDPWGAAPEPEEGERPDEIAHLWPALLKASDVEPPNAQDLRDLADYARRTGLPDDDRAIPRVAIEGAWAADPSPRTVLSWVRLMPDDEREAIQTAHPPVRPVRAGDVFAGHHLQLRVAWDHYYARRHKQALHDVEMLLADAPNFVPAWRLAAVLLEDLGLSNAGVRLLDEALKRWPKHTLLKRARISALRSAGRPMEAITALEMLVAGGGRADDRYQLAQLLAGRRRWTEALAQLDEVAIARTELWRYALEASRLAHRRGDSASEGRRLRALWAQIPGEATVARSLLTYLLEAGQLDEARAVHRVAAAANPDDEAFKRGLALTPTTARRRTPLGPPLDILRAAPVTDAPAQVLYHHARTEVNARGLAVRRVRRVVRILTEEGARRFDVWDLVYVPGAQRLEVEVAQLLRAGAPPASPHRSDRDLSEPEYRLYYDLRAEVLTFDRPQPGDVIEVSWRLEDLDADPAFPGYYGEVAYFQEAAPRVWSVLELGGEGAAGVQLEVHGLKTTRTAIADGGWRVEAHDVPGVALERDMPGPSSLRAYGHLSTATGWAEVDRRYRKLLGGRDLPTPQLETLARAWTEGATTPEAKAARLYTEVAHRIRYVGLEFGVHSFQPQPPAVTLSRGYGDCKDKATLLVALCRSVGVEANLVLVRTRDSGAIESAPASFAIFDHAIVYLPTLDRFMDPTVDRNDPWNLPPPDQGAMAFVVGVDTALRTIPAQAAEANESVWLLTGRIQPDGAIEGTMRWQTRGQPASEARRALEAEGTRQAVVTQALVARLPGVHPGAPTVTGLLPALDPVVVEVPVTMSAMMTGLELPLGWRPWGLVGRYAQPATRETTLQIVHRRTEVRRLDLALPPGVVPMLPKATRLKSEFGTLTGHAEVVDGRLRAELRLQLTAFEVSPAAYPAFRAWLGAVDRAAAGILSVPKMEEGA